MTDLPKRKVLVPIADGTEEIEAVCIIDVLRRAGADVTVASVGNLQITASRGVKLVADCKIADCRDDEFDLIALPGGIPGAEHLRDSQPLVQLLRRHQAGGGWYGAICAAPAVVLSHHGLLGGRKVDRTPVVCCAIERRHPHGRTRGGRRQLRHQPGTRDGPGVCPDPGRIAV